MKVFIFKCRARPMLFGATRYETGSNLPMNQCSGGWEFCERVELTSRRPVRYGVDVTTLQSKLQRFGWYIWDETPKDAPRRFGVEAPSADREQTRVVGEPEDAADRTDHSRVAAEARVTAEAPPMASSARTVSENKPETSTPRAQVRPVAERPITPTASTPAPQREMSRAGAVASPPAAAPSAPIASDASAARPVAAKPRHAIVWFDIPVRDLDRAVRFYSAVCGRELKKQQAGPGLGIAILPHVDSAIGGCLILSNDAKPSETGPLLYLNTHGRLDEVIKAVEANGGRILTPKQSIEPFGFRAIVLDSEGNRVALHSES